MDKLRERLRQFADERDWGQFHTPKNLSMALSAEVAEILEIFQWLTPEESSALPPERLEALRQEIGDVQIYLTLLSDRFGIDPIEAARAKIGINERKYPAEKSRGKADKYTGS